MQGPRRCSNNAINTSVVGAGIFASFVAPGAVYCAEKIAPDKMIWLKKQFAEQIVEPYLPIFRKLSKGLRHAHERYDARKRDSLIAQGAVVPDFISQSLDRKQEAYVIADAWVTGLVAASADLATNYGALKVLNRIPGVENKAGSISVFDTGFSLLGMAAMPTLIPGISENVNHGISRLLRKFGMSKEGAENISIPATYVQFPALMGLLSSLVFAHKTNGIHK